MNGPGNFIRQHNANTGIKGIYLEEIVQKVKVGKDRNAFIN